MCGHREDGPHCDDPCAPYAGDQNIAMVVIAAHLGLGQCLDQCLQSLRISAAVSGRFARLATDHRHETGTESLGTGIIFVAAGLLNGTLASERRFYRYQRQAIGLGAAVAAALAYRGVDE